MRLNGTVILRRRQLNELHLSPQMAEIKVREIGTMLPKLGRIKVTSKIKNEVKIFMEERKSNENTNTHLNEKEIKEIAPGLAEKTKEIENIESELETLKKERLLLCLDIILFIAIGVPMLCVLAGIRSIDPSNQFVSVLLIVGLLLMCLGFKMQVDNPQTEKRMKGQKIIFVGEIIDFIGMLLMVQ